jgi:hypothetical protein
VSRVSLSEKLAAIVRRDVLTTIRYRNGFLLSAVGVLAEVAAFRYMARAIGPSFRPEGVDYFPFLLVGSGFYTFLITGVQAFLSTVQEAQQTGTLEVLLTTATPAPVLIFLSAFSAFAGKLANLVLFLAVGLLLFRVPLLHPNLLGVGLIFVLSLAVVLALGVFAAALQVAVQKGSAVIWLLGSVWFLTGTRGALLLGKSTAELAPEILWLSATALVLVPASLQFFSWVLRRGRREGTLSAY